MGLHLIVWVWYGLVSMYGNIVALSRGWGRGMILAMAFPISSMALVLSWLCGVGLLCHIEESHKKGYQTHGFSLLWWRNTVDFIITRRKKLKALKLADRGKILRARTIQLMSSTRIWTNQDAFACKDFSLISGCWTLHPNYLRLWCTEIDKLHS